MLPFDDLIRTHSDFLFFPLTFRIISQTFNWGSWIYFVHILSPWYTLASLIVLRTLARASAECIWFSRDGFLLNFRNADLRLLIAVSHSSLNHGLRLFDLVYILPKCRLMLKWSRHIFSCFKLFRCKPFLGWKKTKRKEAERIKSYPNRHMKSKWRRIDVNTTSSRRINLSTTLFWHRIPVGILMKQVKSQGAHGVLLTSMRRNYVASTSIWRHVDTLNCFTCLSK